MKRVINGRAYNTDTATAVYVRKSASNVVKFDSKTQKRYEADTILYQTVAGAFLLFEENPITPESSYFEPLSRKKTIEWLENNAATEDLERIFGEFPEAGEKVREFRVRVPAHLKQRADKAASNAGLSLNLWSIRCFELCLKQKELADLLARIVWIHSVVRNKDRNINQEILTKTVDEICKYVIGIWEIMDLPRKKGQSLYEDVWLYAAEDVEDDLFRSHWYRLAE